MRLPLLIGSYFGDVTPVAGEKAPESAVLKHASGVVEVLHVFIAASQADSPPADQCRPGMMAEEPMLFNVKGPKLFRLTSKVVVLSACTSVIWTRPTDAGPPDALYVM
jgi:hypothetical protein